MYQPLNDPELTADLIGYHLGLCDEADRARVEHALGTGPALSQARAALAHVLAPLDADDTPEPPADLVAGILDRVSDVRNRLPLRPAAPTEAGAHGSGPLFSLRELLSLAAVIAIFVGVFVPGYRAARLNSQQALCASNLRQIGIGSAQYADMHGGFVPVVASIPDGAPWASANRPGARQVGAPQTTFALVRWRFVTPSAFHCPGRPDDAALSCPKPEALDEFPDPRNNSYSTQILTPTWRQQQLQPQSPVAADLTPLVDQQRRLFDYGPIPFNSTSHRGKGQNVLRRNLSVRFSNSPNVGLDNDDIYRVIGVQQYTGFERPRLRSDAFLVP
jgi:hypothetical protein